MQIKLAFSLTRVWQHYQNKRFAIVSAYLTESSPEINEARAALADPASVAHRISQAYSKLSLKHSAPFILTIGVESTTLKRFE